MIVKRIGLFVFLDWSVGARSSWLGIAFPCIILDIVIIIKES